MISDEAHRTQPGKLARNMRLALPNAAFIGFTGTPLFKHDELTKRIFGSYASRYDFKRSEEDGATVKLVCIDKVTCARMLKLIQPLWKAKALVVRAEADAKLAQIDTAPDEESRQQLYAQRDRLLAKAAWIEQTIIEIIISEVQNEVADFNKWNFDIIPDRGRIKQGFKTPDGKRVDVESAFKNPGHPFRGFPINAGQT